MHVLNHITNMKGYHMESVSLFSLPLFSLSSLYAPGLEAATTHVHVTGKVR